MTEWGVRDCIGCCCLGLNRFVGELSEPGGGEMSRSITVPECSLVVLVEGWGI